MNGANYVAATKLGNVVATATVDTTGGAEPGEPAGSTASFIVSAVNDATDTVTFAGQSSR